MRGKFLPFGWWHFLRKGKIMTECGRLPGRKARVPAHWVAAKLYQLHSKPAEARPQKGGEMGWILETNTAMNRGMERWRHGRQALSMYERLLD